MPIVPRINPAPLPGVRVGGAAPDAAFGGGAGNVTMGLNGGLSAVHQAAAGIAQEEKVRADQIALTDAGAKASSAMSDVLYGPSGALTKKGKDALTAPEDTRAAYFGSIGQVRAGLANDDQRVAFDRIVANDWSRIDEQVQRHVAQQRVAYDTDATDAFVANKQNEALNSYGDPAAAEAAIADQRQAITAYGARNGWDAEQTKQAVAKQVSKTRFDVLSRLLDNEQDLAASAYLQQHRGEFSGEDVMRAEKLVDVGSVRGESQRQADDIASTATSLTDALRQVQDIPEPRVRDATEQRVRRHFEDKAADDRQERAAAFQQANEILERTKDAGQIPLAVRVKLTPEENGALDRREDQLRHPKTQTNLSVYTHLINLSSLNDATRAQFLTTDLAQYRGQLSDEDYKHLLNLQRSARLGDDRADDAATRRVRQREESSVIKSADQASREGQSAQVLRDRMKKQGKSEADISKIVPQPKAPAVVVPQWMTDSAATDPEYASYLRSHGVSIAPPSASAPAQQGQPGQPAPRPQRPSVPGAPLPKRSGFDPASFGVQPTNQPAPKRVTIKRDSSGRVIGLHQE